MGDAANGGGCACVGTGGIWEISVPPNFAVNLKLLWKKVVFFKIVKTKKGIKMAHYNILILHQRKE